MATVTFAGSTLWNDAATGVGRIYAGATPGRVDWLLERLPQGSGLVAKNLGRMPGGVIVPMEYRLTLSEANALFAVWAGIVGDAGTLSVPPGVTYANAILRDWQQRRGDPVFEAGSGTVRYQWLIVGTWQQLR